MQARIDGFENAETVIFRLEDGRTTPYPIAKLGEEDRRVAESAYLAHTADAGIDWDQPMMSESYVIKGVSRENAPGYVSTKSGWEWQAKCIEARLSYRGTEEIGKGNVKAYFYTRDGKLLDKVNAPPRRQDKNREYINAPTSFERGKTIETYFPLTEFLETSGWSTVLIAFGSGDDYMVDTLPNTSLKDLDFDEKKYLFPDWDPERSRAGSPGSMAEVDLQVRRIRQEKHGYSILFDGEYLRNQPCVSAEVRATGDIHAGDGKVKLYIYAADGTLIGSKAEPSSAQIGGTRTYVENPRIADDRWHSVYFALDQGLAADHPTYLCVFEFGGNVVAELTSSAGATLDDLDFPEKSRLEATE